MSPERQINANRINGARSRGPLTPEGKLASPHNSLVHGLLSQVIIFDGESLIAEFQPETPTECGLVKAMVVCRWRLMRVWILENSAVSHEIRKQAVANALENMPTQVALAYRTLSDESRWLDVFSRYEVRFDRQLSRAIQRFNEVRAGRKKKKVIFPGEPNSDSAGDLLSPEGID